VPDGARNAARGLRYQYLRTLEALMDAVEQPGQSVEAVHVEGRPDAGGQDVNSIDYELSDASGHVVSAVQVKARAPGFTMGPGEIFKVLAGLVSDRDATRYELLTNARAGDGARKLVAVLDSGLDFPALRAAIDTVLASVSADRPRDWLRHLNDEHIARLRRVRVEFDFRDDAEISEGLRSRLRRYRNRSRVGLGDESAGLVIDHLISEVFRRAGNAVEATLPVSHFRALLLVDGAILARALGRRDWGVVVGPLPVVPDVRRAEMIDLVHSALPLTAGNTAPPRCALTGMSGIGKTSLAVGYLLDRADIYDVIFWVDAESEQSLTSSFTRIFRHLRGGDSSAPSDPAHLRDAVLSDLSCVVGRWLLVLDNCVNLHHTEKWVPQTGSGHVIVTTNDSASPPRAGLRVEVGGMAVLQAVELLRRRLAPAGELDGPQLKQLLWLARELECWPLALELASAYLYGSGLGIDGVPEYLHRLKLRSLGDLDSIPPGYPRTLIQAINLCVQRIREKTKAPEPQGAWVAIGALAVLRIAAYMSSRQIPVYLVMSVPEVGPEEEAEAFRGDNPIIADDPDHPPAEVVRMLRVQSLVAVDEDLPADGINSENNRRYDYTISVNSVLQEVMRASYDNDQLTGLIVDRLAWHTERWMKAALLLGRHERALILATHAAALEGHATRLNLKTDFIAYLRGNLASIQYRQNKKAQVAYLLRSEIDHYRGRDDEHAQLLTCQASMQLAVVLAQDEAGPADEITSLLEDAYFIVLSFVSRNPEGMAFLASSIRTTLSSLELRGVRHERLAMLAIAVEDLAGRLPATPLSMAMRTLDEIAACLHEHRDCGRASELARTLLAQEFLADETQENIQLRCKARKSLIEALAALHDLEGALTELGHFTADTQPPSMFVHEIEDMVHNVGLNCALLSLISVPHADELLSRLLSDGRAELIQSSFPEETAARIRLLGGVNAFNHGDLRLAQQCVDEFLEKQAPHEDEPWQRRGWRKVANILADVMAIQQDKEKGPIRPLTRLHDDSGLGRLLLFPMYIQHILAYCGIELLPLHAALALVHSELSGSPGTRCVPVCHQLQGGLEHLGFDGEVIAASAMLLRDGDDEPEHVGEYGHAPSLRDDGSTDGHAVLWTASFGQLVDPTIVLARHLQAVAEDNPVHSFPVVLPIANRESLLGSSAICSSSRAPLNIAWVLQPQWTRALIPVPGSDLDIGLSYAKLALAHTTLEVIRGLEGVHSDFQRLRTLYPPIAALLDGRSQLPRLPDGPPAAFLRLLRPDAQA
jgi:hypothetical protein